MNRNVVGRRIGLAAPFLVLLSGCVALETNLLNPSAPPPPGVPCQVIALWQPQVYYPPDPVHGGVGSATLAGRVYLYGQEVGCPMIGDGKLVVAAYAEGTTPSPDVVPLKAWIIDPDTLHRFLKKDVLGWGYTVPLPWPDLPPELTRVQMKVCYIPVNGTPLYTDVAPLTLSNPGATAPGAPVVTQSAKPHVR